MLLYLLSAVAATPRRVAYSSRWPNNAGKSVTTPCFTSDNAFAAAVFDFTGSHQSECNVTAPPASCFTAAKSVKACLDAVPAGHRAVHLNTGVFMGGGVGVGGWAEADPGSPRGWTVWADQWAGG